eukprot:gene1781-33200_t
MPSPEISPEISSMLSPEVSPEISSMPSPEISPRPEVSPEQFNAQPGATVATAARCGSLPPRPIPPFGHSETGPPSGHSETPRPRVINYLAHGSRHATRVLRSTLIV